MAELENPLMLIDLLDRLEWYRDTHPLWQSVIDILDRSLPYDDPDGEHFIDTVRYQVETYRTTERGSEAVAEENRLLVLLEGEELFSLSEGEEVMLSTVFTEGLFIYLRKGERYKSRQTYSQEKIVRRVVFFLP
ncbi:MAG: DUF386 domain-containing protein [Spirochaetales bacterium]|nr:DUF386 domain-containing protein [Spirochaetales bacterium]